MRIGYPCINRSIGCTPSHTFRLASYSDERLRATVQDNLSCLRSILEYNARHGMFFLRISSDMVPFASHPVCRFPWQDHFFDEFQALGEYIRKHRFRISMHPDQFVLLNTPNEDVLRRSIDELMYHARILELMELDRSAKIQLHVGGVYGNKIESINRFIHVYDRLDDAIRQRLVIENDERLYAASDCLAIHQKTGVPVLFDRFHHAIKNQNEVMTALLPVLKKTWRSKDGIPMIDYSSQQPGKRVGAHTEHIDTADFARFLAETSSVDCDIMLEIKDKEKSVLAALDVARDDPRLFTGEP